MTTLWLASGSPRRRDLLRSAGVHLEVRPSDIDESRPAGIDPVAHAERLARGKAAVAPTERLVLAADTVVHQGDTLFDKPTDRDEARAHLAALAGGWHHVTTGVCVARAGEHKLFHVTTEVRIRALTAAEIDAYVETGDADDKAGAYGIQSLGGGLVAELRGSYTNVVGLPLEQALAALDAFGLERFGHVG